MRASPIGTIAWLGPVGAAVAGAALLAMLLPPPGARSLFGAGIAYTVATYDLVLPLIGLGIALARTAVWPALVVVAAFVAAVPLGFLVEHQVAAALTLGPDASDRLVFAGPLCCLVVGLALAPAGALRLWIMPVAAVLAGAMLGFLIAFHDPSLGNPRFAWGAAAAGLWLAVTPWALLQRVDRAWLRIGSRIFASWLVAIGLLLGGSKYVAQHRYERATALPPAPPSYQPPAVDAPAIGEGPTTTGRPRQWDDPSQQP